MSIAGKGSRRITVDSASYRWSVRPRPTYAQALLESCLSFAVDMEGGGQTTLLVKTDTPRPDNWLGSLGNVSRAITPSVVERAIRQALVTGWQPGQCGSAFELTIRLA